MADRKGFGGRDAAPGGLAARLRRQELEDTPMSHWGTRVDASACQGCGACRSGELAALLEEQNRLLYDILGAVTSLTAAQLAAGQTRRT